MIDWRRVNLLDQRSQRPTPETGSILTSRFGGKDVQHARMASEVLVFFCRDAGSLTFLNERPTGHAVTSAVRLI